MKRRIFAWLLSTVMLLSLLSASAIAASETSLTYSNSEEAETATGVTANKKVVQNEDGTYTITLSVKGYTETGSETKNYPADVVLVLDTSRSMQQGGRLDTAKAAAENFVETLLGNSNTGIKVGLVAFNTNATSTALSREQTTLNKWIDDLSTNEGTNYGAGLTAAQTLLSGSTAQKFIVFISDGAPGLKNVLPDESWLGKDVANTLKKDGVTIMTVGVDLDDGDAGALKNISSTDKTTNKPLYQPATSSDLSAILNKLTETITTSINAGTNAVMTDIINTKYFELVENSTGESLTVEENGKLTWNIDNIGENPESATFQIRLLENNTDTGELETNKDVSLTFNSAKQDGKEVTFDKGAIGNPSVKVYSVTYKDGADGSVFADQITYNLPENTETPAFDNGMPTRKGYTFKGWSPEVSQTVGGDTYGIVYTATWEQLTYTVTGTIDNGTVTNGSQTVTHGEASEAMTFTPAEHYRIKSVTENGAAVNNQTIGEDGTYTYPAQTNVTGNITVAVTTEPIPYTVTYNKGANGTLTGQDENGNVTTTATYGDNTSAAPAVTADDGWYFTGWDPTVTNTVTKSVTYTAQYAPMGTVTIKGASGELPYNGTEQMLTDYEVLPAGYAISGVNYCAKGKDASEYKGEFTFDENSVKIYDESNNDVTDKVTIGYKTGTLTITKEDPATIGFDLDRVDGGQTAAITKTVEGSVGSAFRESFTVTVTPQSNNAADTMGGYKSLRGTAEVTEESRRNVPFVFTAQYEVEPIANSPVRNNNNQNEGAELFFTKAGEYTYTVREDKGNTGSMSYDTTAYTLTITVKAVEGDNQDSLEVESWRFSKTNTNKEPLNIVNTYKTRYNIVPSTPKPALNTDGHFSYIMGYPDGTVRPESSITRAEVATIFFRLLSDASREEFWSTVNSYGDVTADEWYNNAVSTLSNAGVISGYPDGTFRPDAPITRAEMAKIIALFAKLDKSENRFNDIAGHWAEAYIRLAAGNGWLAGYPDGSFRPQQSITRAETVTMINRVLERVPADESRLLSRDAMLTFPDNRLSAWYYIAIQEAANSHTYQRAASEKNGDEQWIGLRENRDWSVLEK